MIFRNGYRTTTFALAGVFTGTTVVAGFTPALALAVVHTLALVLGNSGTSTMTFTRILSGTTRVTGLAPALTLA